MGQIHGRGREQAALAAELERTLAGSPGLVLISGEPGIGKTTLLEDLADRMHDHGGVVGWGTCWDGDGAPSFWPWQRALPQFGELLTSAPEDDPGHFALFTAVADLAAHTDRPQLLVLDDLQWADEDCLRLLRFLARDLRGCPVLLAGSFRDVGVAPDHPVRALAAESVTSLHLSLPGINDAAIAAVISDTTGASPPDELVERVRVRTAGNPFFVREIARLPEPEVIRLTGPASDAVGARIDPLPAHTHAALTIAAVIGRDVEDDLLARAVGSDVDDLRSLLAPAIATRLVERSGPGRHRFVHDLVREHLLESQPVVDLRRLHRTVYDALAGLPGIPMHASRIAAHAVRAVPELDAATAIGRCDVAADEAERQHLFDESARHLSAAVALDGGAEPARRLRLADDLRRAGRLSDAHDGYTTLLDDGDAVVRARAAVGLHEVGVASTETRQPLVDALETAASNLDEHPDQGLLADVTAALARELADGPQRDVDRAEALADRAVALARGQHDRRLLAACLFARHDVIWSPGTAAERAELAGEIVRAADPEAPDLAFQGALCRYVALLELASPDAEAALAEVEARAQRTGQPLLGYLARTRRDAWDAMAGAAGVEVRIEQSYDLGVRLEVPDAYGVFVTQLVCVDLAGSDPPAAMQARREHLGGQLMPPDFATEERAFELLALGDPGGAAALVAGAPSPAERAMFRWRALAAVAFLADLSWRTDAATVASDCYDHLAPHAGQLVVIGGGVAVVGPVDLYLGLAARASGRPELGSRHLEAALTQARTCGARPWAARISALLAPPAHPAVFRREGAVWRLEYADRVVHAPDTKGMHDLAHLLARPGEPASALELVGDGATAPQVGSDPVLDDAARASYRQRLEQLDQEIDDATLRGDDDALRRAQDERDALLAELSRAVGLGGRARRLGDPGERARSTVTARIRDTLTRIEAQHPELGTHLRAAVRTGRECVYLPDTEIRWQL